MTQNKKVVLDADVIIHFSKGEMLSILPQIMSDFQHIVLSKVYDEIRGDIKIQLDNQVRLLKNISIVEFKPSGEQLREYAMLTRRFGGGESACMVYCRYNKDIIGSSNLKDITAYCKKHSIEYYTTIDFLRLATEKGIISTIAANEFIAKVKSKGSKLPDITF